MEKKYPQFIDFEASGLSDESYPIEVAWNASDGTVTSYLINPDSIKDWTYWDPYAERNAHQITQTHLKEQGTPPGVVAAAMNEALAGCVLYCDAPEFDGFWLQRLFDGVDINQTFKLGSAIELFDLMLNEDAKVSGLTHQLQQERFDIIMDTYGKTAWDNISLRPHRAGHDVKHLIETYRLLLEADGHLQTN